MTRFAASDTARAHRPPAGGGAPTFTRRLTREDDVALLSLPQPVGTDEPAEAAGADGARSLTEKALAILDAFSADRALLSLSDIARRAALPLSTTHRIVQELRCWGALERMDCGGYSIGMHLWEVASLAPRGPRLIETAVPFLGDLYEATHENVELAVRDGSAAIVVERLAGHDSVRLQTRVGGRCALPTTGVGLVLLAHAPLETQERVLAGSLPRLTRQTVTDPRELRRLLADVRRCGIAVSSRQTAEDTLAVAAPVFGPRDEVVAAVSVVTRAGGPDHLALVPAVRAAARGLSRALGSPTAARSPIGARRRPA